MQLTAAIVGPAHGLRGEVILDVRSDDPEVLAPGASLEIAGRGAALTVRSVRVHKDRVLASFEECASREDAEALRGARLLVEEHEEEDAWYPHQLKGLAARTPGGEDLGTVTGLTPGAAQDLLLVKTPAGTVMVPFVTQLVPTVDVEGGVVIIDAPPGLFDDQAVSERDGK
jgi:16S rRNA processing protein rimM|nr:ribosome maturation factor RimM [uncultured Actinomyces sp.]